MLETIRIEQKILGQNEEYAARNRRRLDEAGVFTVVLSGSPGGGKTSLLERALPLMPPDLRPGVVEGDIETALDGKRIAALGVPVTQVVTGGTCHLEAGMIEKALDHLDLQALDVLFLENVGNLVCPAAYALGESIRVIVLSTTEGEDKPLKYPAMFRKADALIINKVDLLPYLSVDLAAAEAYARQVKPDLPVFRTSCVTGEGIEEWIAWLSELRQSWKQASSRT